MKGKKRTSIKYLLKIQQRTELSSENKQASFLKTSFKF